MQIRLRIKAALASIFTGATIALGAKAKMLEGLDFGRLEARKVRVYMPAAGVTSSTPVLIALDGQNMAAWRLEEALAGVAAQGKRKVPLVVAIPSGKDRLDEYGLAGESRGAVAWGLGIDMQLRLNPKPQATAPLAWPGWSVQALTQSARYGAR